MLDEWTEWAALGASVVIMLGMILLYLRAGGHLKLRRGKDEIEAGHDDEEPTTSTTCPIPLQTEHEAHFERIDETLAKLAEVESQNSAMLRAIDRMQRAQNVGLIALLRKANGEDINGDVKAALEGLANAEGYKEATMGGTI